MTQTTTNTNTNAFDHLKPFEAAARILCQMDGVDPDATVSSPHPVFPGVLLDAPVWHGAAESLIALSKMLTAMRQAADLAAAPKTH